MKPFLEIIESAPSLPIYETLLKGRAVLDRHYKCAVSVSGGSDSDIIMDLVELWKPYLEYGCEVKYVFFDTGLEYAATKRHLDYAEWRYGVEIIRRKARRTIPLACKEHGYPFISKDVSDKIGILQRNNFNWLDSFENAIANEAYANFRAALLWWFDARSPGANGKDRFSIRKYKLLHDFMAENPPDFPISDKCCDYAKKYTSDDFYREYPHDLAVNGMRHAEGGRRAGSIQTCFTPSDDGPDNYRPLWYWTDEDKSLYKAWREIRYSDCYEVYGLKRTGCVGCPFNSRAEQELAKVEKFEPKLVLAARNIFRESYEYKRRYMDFKKERGGKNARS